MNISKEDAVRFLKSLTAILLDCADNGTLPVESLSDTLELLLILEEALGDAE